MNKIDSYKVCEGNVQIHIKIWVHGKVCEAFMMGMIGIKRLIKLLHSFLKP
jgi:hypothetical protein